MNSSDEEQRLVNENKEDVASCRICYGTAEDGRLIKPCKCSGSVRYIHVSCLDKWRMTSANQNNAVRCDMCHYEYQFSRVLLAKFLQNPKFISFVSFLIIAITVLLIAYFIRAFFYLVLGVKLTKTTWALSSKIVWWAILLIGFVFALFCLLAAIFDNNGANDMGSLFRIMLEINWSGDPGLFFNCLGYSFSFMGFGMFVKGVYQYVFFQACLILDKFGNSILEVT